uniref:Uncharacterized protein n=1 Tax=Zea mays TaxID=4577 RepID=A0A804MYF5_MAIZE
MLGHAVFQFLKYMFLSDPFVPQVQMQPGQPSMSANRVYYQRSLVREIEARLKAKCDTLADLFAMDERLF